MATGARHSRFMTKVGRYSPSIAYPTRWIRHSEEFGGRISQKFSRLAYGTASRDALRKTLFELAAKVDEQRRSRVRKGDDKLPELTELVEQLARRIWSEWLTLGDRMRIAEQFGYPKNQYGYATRLNGVEWGVVPENVKDHVRGMAEKEIILIQTTPQTEATKYLVALFRELERLRPSICGAMSHGIAWDDKKECLVLLVNCGDCVYAHRLRPNELISDPVATAANLMAKVEPELANDDADLITFKR
jgi:hypothetical protein